MTQLKNIYIYIQSILDYLLLFVLLVVVGLFLYKSVRFFIEYTTSYGKIKRMTQKGLIKRVEDIQLTLKTRYSTACEVRDKMIKQGVISPNFDVKDAGIYGSLKELHSIKINISAWVIVVLLVICLFIGISLGK